MEAGGLVVADGDRVTAAGRLVRNDLGDWFEPLLPAAGPAARERRIRAVWKGAVQVEGAGFDAVADRFASNGEVEGWATITGSWSDGRLHAERQDPGAPRPAAPARWVRPPCPPPEGGWPAVQRQGGSLSYDLGELAGSGAAVAVTLFHPGQNQPVLVVAAADPAAVEARLRPQLGRSLCIVPSRWTKRQLDDVHGHLQQHFGPWHLYQLGPQHTGDGQALIAARLIRVLPQIAAWAASLPPGILALEPWLAPDTPAPPPEHPANGRP